MPLAPLPVVTRIGFRADQHSRVLSLPSFCLLTHSLSLLVSHSLSIPLTFPCPPTPFRPHIRTHASSCCGPEPQAR